MVAEILIVFAHVVIHHAAVARYQRNTQSVHIMFADEVIESLLIVPPHILHDVGKVGIVCLQLDIERIGLVLLLAGVLKEHERNREKQKNAQYRDVKATAY